MQELCAGRYKWEQCVCVCRAVMGWKGLECSVDWRGHSGGISVGVRRDYMVHVWP